MELGPILRSLFQNRTRTALIVLEIALTLAVVVNCLAMIRVEREKILRPTGIDEDSILVVTSSPFDPEYQEDSFIDQASDEDLRTLQAIPGVRSASGFLQIPLSGGGSSSGRSPTGEDDERRPVPYFVVTQDAVETLGVELAAGRAFTEDDFISEEQAAAIRESGEPRQRNVIITKHLADLFFPDGDAIGKQFLGDTYTETIVGVMERMHGPWPLSDLAEDVMLIPGRPANSRFARYLVRMDEDASPEMATRIEEALVGIQQGRIVRVESMTEIKGGYYNGLTTFNTLLGVLSVLLVAVTALGIVGADVVHRDPADPPDRDPPGARRDALRHRPLLPRRVDAGDGSRADLGARPGLRFELRPRQYGHGAQGAFCAHRADRDRSVGDRTAGDTRSGAARSSDLAGRRDTLGLRRAGVSGAV